MALIELFFLAIIAPDCGSGLLSYQTRFATRRVERRLPQNHHLFTSLKTLQNTPANKRMPPSMSVGRVGIVTPSGRFTFSRGAMKAAIPAIIRAVPTYFMGYTSGVSKSWPCQGARCGRKDQIQIRKPHATSPAPTTNNTSPTTSIAAPAFAHSSLSAWRYK